MDAVDANFANALVLLERTVNIESPTENLAGVKQVGSLLLPEFKAIGMKTRWIEMPAGTDAGLITKLNAALEARARQTSFLVPGLRITLRDERRLAAFGSPRPA